MQSLLRLTGIGLRAPHYTAFLEAQPGVAWVEVHSEHFFAEGGKALQVLETVRRDYPVSLHGMSLSLGSSDELNWQHLHQLKNLIDRIDPCLVSDHAAWSSLDGQYFHDLLPLPLTPDALKHFVSRIQQVQEYLKRQILIENVSSYVRYKASSIPEPAFLVMAAEQSGCGILLDINNVYLTSRNLSMDASQYLSQIPSHLVQEFHLAGFTSKFIQDKEVLIDSHNKPISPAVWDLYRSAVKQLGRKPTIIEWDNDLPSLHTLCLEANRAEAIMRESYDATKLTG